MTRGQFEAEPPGWARPPTRALERQRSKRDKIIGVAMEQFAESGYEGDRNDVAVYLDTLGWRSSGQPMSELLAEHGLPPAPQTSDSVSMADTIYYTSTK